MTLEMAPKTRTVLVVVSILVSIIPIYFFGLTNGFKKGDDRSWYLFLFIDLVMIALLYTISYKTLMSLVGVEPSTAPPAEKETGLNRQKELIATLEKEEKQRQEEGEMLQRQHTDPTQNSTAPNQD